MNLDNIPDDVIVISEITNDFHKAGVLSKETIIEIFKRTRHYESIQSIETGCGKSTLLFSNISKKHFCFTLGGSEVHDDGSLDAVKKNPHFREARVEFVLGPTQKTIPSFPFKERFQVIFIDGPHGYPFPELEYYFLYPHLEQGGLLIIDDIHIPTIGNLADFLKEDDMFEFMGNVSTTAFFRRTTAPLFDPYGDGWWLQKYNTKRFDKLAAKYLPRNVKAKIYASLASLGGIKFADNVRNLYRKVFR
jgi:hypothetical protein